MGILFDQGVPGGLTASLVGHEITEARKLKWERISNGALLELAEKACFNLVVTTDKNVRHQQNFSGRIISIVVLGQSPWWLVRRHLDTIVAGKKLLPANPCSGVEFPVRVKGRFRPHYMAWSEQQRIEFQAPEYLRNIIRIITESGSGCVRN